MLRVGVGRAIGHFNRLPQGVSSGGTSITGNFANATIDSAYSSSVSGPAGMTIDATSAAILAEYNLVFNGSTGALTSAQVGAA